MLKYLIMILKKVLSATTGFTDVKLKNGANLRFEIQGYPNENINIFLVDLSIDIQEIIRINSFCNDWNQAKLIIKCNDYIHTVYDNEVWILRLYKL